MIDAIKRTIRKAGITEMSVLPFRSCTVLKPHLLAHIGFDPQSVIVGLIPYLSPVGDGPRTVSSYAVPKDYHIFIKELADKIEASAAAGDGMKHAAVFGDHSPIDEVRAAAAAGLGIIGKNGLLINEKYSSYVFIFEVLTDSVTDRLPGDIRECENCGSCAAACPSYLSGGGKCLSAVTQKKGTLDDGECELIRRYRTVWGCDICQEACPHTAKARAAGTLYTDIAWFRADNVPSPCPGQIDDDGFLRERAYSWRGSAVIMRNIGILGEKDKEKSE